MADNKTKWQEAKRQIIDALDIAAEYAVLGVRFSSKSPSAKGWLDCHAIDREDNTPSAGVNVGDGPMRGRYKDFVGTGKTIGLFDFAARVGKFGGDWREALKHYSRQTAIKLPEGAEELAADKFEFFDLTASVSLLYAAGKPGVTATAVRQVGGIGARWPKGLPAEKTNHLIAFPMYGSALLDMEPTGWHCVASNPKVKIRQFQGKGHDDKLLKVMTVGEYGLMNVDGLNRLLMAEVVWIVEGISDLLALQSLLPPGWLHIVVSAGGCSYHPKAEWMQHFAGKDCRLVFDVGDADNAGQIGAGVWISSLVPVAKAIRNVELPLGKDGGKNDLRAWIVEGHTYQDLLDLADTFEPIEPGDAAQISPHQAILQNLGLVVIGEHEGSQKIEIFSERTKKAGTILDIDKLTISKLVQHVGPEVVDEFVHDGKEAMPGKHQLKDVRLAIAAAASDKMFGSDEKLGAGVWQVDGTLLLVKSQEVGIFNGSAKLERSSIPFYHGRMLDLSRSVSDWYDPGTMARHFASAQKNEWCWQAFERAEHLFSKWYWRHRQTPRVLASLVICSWVQTLWEWRPQIAITGGSDTGKSLLMEDVLRGIFGQMGLYVTKPTEAAVRQHVRHHAKILMVDEFEHDNHRQKVLELLRTSSRGGKTIRGTSDQRGASFGMRHIPWVAGIETGLHKQADRNRFVVLELKDIPAEARGKIDLPTADQLHELGYMLLAIALRHQREAMRLAAVIKSQQLAGVPGRVVESFSVPCGMISAIYEHPNQVAAEMMVKILADWDFGAQQSRDENDLLHEILTAEVFLDGGKRSTISQLLNIVTGDPDVRAALERYGLKRINKYKGADESLFICTRTVRKQLLKQGGDFFGHNVDQYLIRIPGAIRDQQRLGGSQRFSGISIPFASIDKIFAGDGSEDQEPVRNTQTELT